VLGALLWAAAGTVQPVGANAADGQGDVTAAVLANRDIALTGDAVVHLTGGTVTYTGVLSGQGTFTVAGTGTLVLTRDSDFTRPASGQNLVTYNGGHPLTRLDNPDPPAVVVQRGATLQYGTGGTTGQIAHYRNVPGGRWNLLNTEVDGTLVVDVRTAVHLGVLSGGGLVEQQRDLWTNLELAGTSPFSGVLAIGSASDYGTNAWLTSLPGLRTVVNDGSAIHGAPDGVVTTDGADYFSRAFGNDVNFHTWGSGLIRMTGVYSWSDNGSNTAPALSDPALDWQPQPHRANMRGINVEGANVQWGDGTTDRIFLPGTAATGYINLHARNTGRSRLTLDYNGPVRLGVPISGGLYADTLAAPGEGDVVIAGTRGNQVTFTAPENYDGTTTIGSGASLRLGDGTPGDDSSLRLGDRYAVIDDGALIVQNAQQAVTLSDISGTGSFTQAGAATTTLTGGTSYRGATTVAKGTLRLTGGSLAGSSGVTLGAPGARLDLGAAGDQTLTGLSGAAGTTVLVGGTLTVGAGTFAGTVSGGSLVKSGGGTLTLGGASQSPHGTWTVGAGTLALTAGASVQAASLTVGSGGTLSGAGRIVGPLAVAGALAPTGLTVAGDYRQQPGARFTASGTVNVTGSASLAGQLMIPPGAAASGKPLTVVHSGGPLTGTFDGLPQGATLNGWTITYTAHDAVLTPGSAAVAAARASHGPGTTAASAASGSGSLAMTLGAAVAAAGLALLVLVLRRRRRRPTRRARSHRAA
jgi:autotransporter-associated beta strand protein